MRFFSSLRSSALWGALLLPLALHCGGAGSAGSSGGGSSPQPPAPQPATEFNGITQSGAAFKLSDYTGKVIVLDVSAMWCGPCRSAAPRLEALYQKYKDKGATVVICLSRDDNNGGPVSQTNLKSWADAYGNTHPVVSDQTSSTPSSGKVEQAYVSKTGGFPTVVVIDKSFKVRYLQAGHDEAAVEAMVQKLLAE